MKKEKKHLVADWKFLMHGDTKVGRKKTQQSE